MESDTTKPAPLKAVINGVSLTKPEELMVVNQRGTWNADNTVFTLQSGNAIPMPEGQDSWRAAREQMLRLGDKRLAAKKAAGKGPKPTSVAVRRERAKRAATGWF